MQLQRSLMRDRRYGHRKNQVRLKQRCNLKVGLTVNVYVAAFHADQGLCWKLQLHMLTTAYI